MREEEAKYVSSQIANKESSQIDQINKQIENQIVKT